MCDAKVQGDKYRFGEYELDAARHQFRRAGELVHVEPRAMDLLCHLVEHRDRAVPKTELLDEVWGDRFVSEAAITTALRTARMAVGDNGTRQEPIRTVHRRATGVHSQCIGLQAGGEANLLVATRRVADSGPAEPDGVVLCLRRGASRGLSRSSRVVLTPAGSAVRCTA
ncbi:hypothetical protein RKD19_008068 [Streptomyces canus]